MTKDQLSVLQQDLRIARQLIDTGKLLDDFSRQCQKNASIRLLSCVNASLLEDYVSQNVHHSLNQRLSLIKAKDLLPSAISVLLNDAESWLHGLAFAEASLTRVHKPERKDTDASSMIIASSALREVGKHWTQVSDEEISLWFEETDTLLRWVASHNDEH